MNRPVVLAAASLIAFATTSSALAQTPQRTTATYGNWTVRCDIHGKAQVCEMAQTMQIKGRPQPISQIAIGRQRHGGALKIVFEVPIDVWLPDGVALVTDHAHANITASFTHCIPVGCFAQADISASDIKKLRSQTKDGQLKFKDARRQLIAIPVSFKGFSDAYDALQK